MMYQKYLQRSFTKITGVLKLNMDDILKNGKG